MESKFHKELRKIYAESGNPDEAKQELILADLDLQTLIRAKYDKTKSIKSVFNDQDIRLANKRLHELYDTNPGDTNELEFLGTSIRLALGFDIGPQKKQKMAEDLDKMGF